MFISDYVVKSPPITANTRPSGRLRHIIKFATYGIRLLRHPPLRPRAYLYPAAWISWR